MRKQLKSLWCHGVLPLLFTRKYCIMHQSIPAAPSPPPPPPPPPPGRLSPPPPPPPPVYCRAFSASSVPGVRHLQILRRPGAKNLFANPGAIPEFLTRTRFPISTSTSPRGAYMWRGDLTEGFLRYRLGELISGGAYFRNFTV